MNAPAPTAVSDQPLVSIAVVTYNALDYVRLCFETLREHTHVPYELIVVDNLSREETREYLRAQTDIRLYLNDENKMWAGGCNQAMQSAAPSSQFFLLLNPDIEVLRHDWVEIMLAAIVAETPQGRVGMVGTRHHYRPVAPVYGFLSGQCLLARRELMEEVGYLDAVNYPHGGSPRLLALQGYQRGWVYKSIKSTEPRHALVRHYKRQSVKEATQPPPKVGKSYEQFAADIGMAVRPIPRPLAWLQGQKSFRKWRDRSKFYYWPPVGPPAPYRQPAAGSAE